MKQFRLLASRGHIASWHNRHSMTWRWSLSFQKRFSGWWKKPIMAGRMKHNCGGFVVLCLGPLAFQYSWQHPMWYRDLYIRLRDEKDFAPVPTPMVTIASESPSHYAN